MLRTGLNVWLLFGHLSDFFPPGPIGFFSSENTYASKHTQYSRVFNNNSNTGLCVLCDNNNNNNQSAADDSWKLNGFHGKQLNGDPDENGQG